MDKQTLKTTRELLVAIGALAIAVHTVRRKKTTGFENVRTAVVNLLEYAAAREGLLTLPEDLEGMSHEVRGTLSSRTLQALGWDGHAHGEQLFEQLVASASIFVEQFRDVLPLLDPPPVTPAA